MTDTPPEPDESEGEPRRPRRVALRTALVLTWAATVVGLLYTVMRLFGLEFTWPLRTLVAYTPHLAAAALLPPIAAALLRRPRLAVAGIVVPLVLATLLGPRFLANEQPPATGPSITVATANMYFGEGDPAALVALVDAHEVDVLSVQELTQAAMDGLDVAGLATRLPYREVSGVDGPSATEGTGVYSRFPLTRNPALEFDATFAMTGVTIAVPGAPAIELLAAHPAAPWAPEQVDYWLADLAKLPPATPDGAVRVLAGDFNATPDHAAFREVLDRGYADAAEQAGSGLTGTWQPRPDSRLSLLGVVPPKVALDHVLVDLRVAVTGVAFGDLPGADHDPVIAELTLPAE
ncbi:endonuclease/exonuclease/phosphatase family protein [Phytomonospora endophytica]|uniref:Endonuclease/exonuclease/phosphatase family metal-dependent hydrolase n=1 Tax=Phytomonospora endophytica TaxID=714109 RepID=A0A841FV96_9ACTN|nr:endonuclease/exonuclease/phosphatase family protein [Phytomonospora endophytica]MBB6037462.1 endonuclease/exonuclease/phosphatase family metal-dependent hydrolase [Phytomonospora endophytica]GIG70712.1 endonuclease [Phytomonospora endophytica]